MKELTLVPYAARIQWQVSAEQGEPAHRMLLAHMLEEVSRQSAMAGARLIGHIKGLAVFPDGGYLRASVTDFDQTADVEGVVSGRQERFEMTLNVLIYGLSGGEVDAVVRAALQGVAAGRGDVCLVESPAHPPGSLQG